MGNLVLAAPVAAAPSTGILAGLLGYEPAPAPLPSPPANSDPKFVAAINERIQERFVEAELPEPEVIEEPAPFEETHAGPVPRNKGGRPKTPWAVRESEDERNRMLEDQILAMLADTEGRDQLARMLDAQVARWNFAEFVRQAWHVIEPSTKLHWNWHHQLMCNVLQAVFMDWLKAQHDETYINKCRNVIFNVPPGSLKSRIIAVCFHAWVWLHWPGVKLICLSVNDDATMRDARAARELISSPWYQDTFKVAWRLRDDQKAMGNYGNTLAGERLSMASKSQIVGLRGDIILIDDPNDPAGAANATIRDEVNNIWQTNQYNRVNDPVRSLRIGVQQRTHAEDWTGNVIKLQKNWALDNREGWLHVILPAEFEPERKFVLPEPLVELLREYLPDQDIVTSDPRTKPGDTIDRVRMPLDFLANERKRWEGTGSYAGQMQQRPAMLEGATVKRRYWNFCRLERGVRPNIDSMDNGRPRPDGTHDGTPVLISSMPLSPGNWDFDWVALTIDCAVKKTERGSNWGILVVAGKSGNRFVLDDRTDKYDILEVVEVLRDLIKLWTPSVILIEDKAAGPDLKLRLLAEMRKGDMPMVTLEDAKPGAQGKEERLDSCLPVIANGCVYLLNGAHWLEAFVEELAMFPVGANDDRVDALTQVLNHFKDYEGDDWPSL